MCNIGLKPRARVSTPVGEPKRIGLPTSTIVAALASLGMTLAGCSSGGGATTTGVPGLSGFAHPAPSSITGIGGSRTVSGFRAPGVATQSVLYATDSAKNSVDMYTISGLRLLPAGSITTGIAGPRDVFVTADHTLFVSNTTSVVAYLQGQTSPAKELALPGKGGRITVGPDGTVFVCGTLHSGRTAIIEFDPGATQPSREIKLRSSIPYPIVCGGLSTDKKGNLYAALGAYGSGGGFAVAVYLPKKISIDRYISTGTGYNSGGVAIVGAQLVVGDSGGWGDPGIAVTDLQGNALRYIGADGDGRYLAVQQSSGSLYATDGSGNGALKILNIASGSLLNTIPGAFAGIAIDPPPK